MQTKPTGSHRTRSSIRHSTDVDMDEIYSWLVEEEVNGIHDNFLCNWSLTERCHQEGRLLVYIDGVSRSAVAYQWGRLVRPGILQVRNDMRGKGIGRKLVERCIADAYKRNNCLLHIHCKPTTSIPFWKTMGFEIFADHNVNNHAYRILEIKHELPTKGCIVNSIIRFYPENRKWDKLVAPYVTLTPLSVYTPDDIVHLGERVFFFNILYPEVKNVIVEIEINGEIKYCDKAKYEKAHLIGLRDCANGFYIDTIHLL